MSKITYEEAIEQGLTRQCTRCKEVKTIDEFSRNKTGKMGSNSECKHCERLRHKLKRKNSIYDKTLFKTCVDCNINKSVEEFNKDGGGHMGVRAECKECRAKRRLADPNHKNKEKVIRNRNKDTNNARHRDKYWNNLEKSRQRVLDYYYDHQEERIAYSRQYKKNNPEKIKLKSKEWAINNPEKVSAIRNRRRTAVSNRIRHDSCEKFIGIFYYVSVNLSRILDEQFHVDHIIPLQGKNISGFHHQANLQVINAKANLSKGNKY